MKYSVIVAALFIISSVSSTSTENNFFKQLQTSEFGKTIIQTIQLELNNEDNSLDQVVDLLKEMKKDAEEENGRYQAQSDASVTSCSKGITQVDEIIASTSEKKAEDERKVPLNEEELQDKQDQAEDKNEEEQRNLDRIALLANERKLNHADYEERRDELVGQIAALLEAKSILSQLQEGGSFLQVSSDGIFAEIKELHQNFMKQFPIASTSHHQGSNQLVLFLLETSTDSGIRSEGLVETVIEVIDDLIESLYDIQKTEMQTEDARQADFVLQKTRILLQNDQMSHQIASLRAAVLVLVQNNLELTNDINSKQQILDNKNSERKHLVKSCQDDQNALGKQREQRNYEIEILEQVLSIFENGLSEEARNYVSQIQIEV